MINDYESEARARWGNTDAYHPNYEIWANKGKYRLKKANISRFWLIFFDLENILRNNYAPFGCNYAPDWCIFFAPCHHKNRGNKRAEI